MGKRCWKKICGIKAGQTCFTCRNRIQINETKDEFNITCILKSVGKQRTVTFDRRICKDPYCGEYTE